MANEYSPSTQDPGTVADNSRAFSTLKAKAEGVGARAAHRADQARVGVAAGMETVASSMHERSDQFAKAGHSAADAVASGAEYLRGHDVQTMMRDLGQVIRRNPGPSLLGAVAVGFLLGRALTRD
jgi:hypothetical protein